MLGKSFHSAQQTLGYTDHWTTGQSRGVGVPKVRLTTHVKSSTLYGRRVVHPNFFRLDGLLLFCIIMGLRSASSAITHITDLKKIYLALLFQTAHHKL